MSPTPGGAVTVFQTTHLTIQCAQEMAWTLDGEFGGAPREARIEVLPRAVEIVHGK